MALEGEGQGQRSGEQDAAVAQVSSDGVGTCVVCWVHLSSLEGHK